MATTLATEKQAQAIKQRMAEIRTELPYNADVARARVQQLTDWKYHLSRHPVPILAAAVVAGYLIVPHKRSTEPVVVHRNASEGAEPTTPTKRGMLGGIAGAVATMVLRQAANAAVNQLTGSLNQRRSKLESRL